MLLAEANQWPEDMQQYFGDGDECHMAVPLPADAADVHGGRPGRPLSRSPTSCARRRIRPRICQWATFLRNHDELTLEMVTDKERDYLWNTYAADRRARLNLGIRRRLAPLLERDRRRIELMNSLLLTIMGTPILYYGDEIGMGDNISSRRPRRRAHADAMDARTAMAVSRAPIRRRWCCRAIMDPLYGYQAVNVEAQWRDPIRCSTGSAACWPFAASTALSAAARCGSCGRRTARCLPIFANMTAKRSSASPICRARRRPSNSTSANSPGARR